MTTKLMGASCIALAAGSTLRTLLIQYRQEENLIQHMASALGMMACEIRWKHRPLPAIFHMLRQEESVGVYFAEIEQMLNRKIPLQDAWQSAFSKLPVERDTVVHIALTGDEAQLVPALEAAVESLQKTLRERKTKRPEQTKLCAAATLSVAGGLILLLL